MKIGKVSGGQVAFFIFAIFLLTAPLSKYLGRELQLSAEWFDVSARIVQLAFLALIILLVERVRPGTVSEMLTAVPADRRGEVALFATGKLFLPFALLGAVMLIHWIPGGALAVEQRFPSESYHANSEASSFSAPGLVFVFAAVAMAPLIEEIAFRGLLYRAWEQAWGWFPAMLASSAVFGLFHAWFWGAFFGGILFVCLYRRTGTLIAPMIAHAIGNACVWYPLLGQHYLPDPARPAGDLSSWWFHFACLSVFVWLIPLYVFMARCAYRREAA